MKEVTIYTDGGCRGNGTSSNVGGYGIILFYHDFCKEVKKGFINTTNNKMELMSIIDALKMLKEPCKVKIYTDSAYVVNAINKNWLESWQKKNWINSSKEPVKNRELWEELIGLLKIHDVTFIKVKGHADNQFNNRCDELANLAMDEIQ